MKLQLDPSFLRSYKKLIQKNPWLKSRIKKTINLFKENPKHPSLRLHKLTGTKYSVWSISVNKSIRILLTYVKDSIILVNIGSHDDVY